MPNWCSTTYLFYASEKQYESELDKFVNEIQDATSKPRLKNGFSNRWLGNVCDAYGIDWQSVDCRGQITEIEEIVEGVIVRTETAWSPMHEMWEIILQNHFPHLGFDYIAEESGCDIYVKHNTVEYFTEKYLVDGCSDDGECYEYLDKEEYIVDYANDLFSKHYGSKFVVPEEVYAFSEQLDMSGSNGDYYFHIHEFEEE